MMKKMNKMKKNNNIEELKGDIIYHIDIEEVIKEIKRIKEEEKVEKVEKKKIHHNLKALNLQL